MSNERFRLHLHRTGEALRPAALTLLLVAAASVAAAQQRTPAAASAGRAKGIMTKVFAATGGKALASMRDITESVTETSFLPQGTMKYEMEIVYGRPGRVLLKTKMAFGEVISGYDRKTGWTKNPMGVQKMNPLQLADMKMTVARNLYHLLQSFNGPEYELSYLGRDRIGGRTVDVVRAFHRSTKTSVTLSVDAQSSLVLKKVSQRRGESGLVDFIDEYADYREVKGVEVPFKTTTSTGGEKVAETVVHVVKINSGLSGKSFSRPEK